MRCSLRRGVGYTYTYDDFGNVNASYDYNASGLRMKNGDTYFIYDGQNIVAEYDLAEDEYIAVYGFAVNRVSRFTSGVDGEIYLFNAHGDVVGLVAISGENVGKTIKEYDYDAFGNEVFPDPDDENSFRYCGEYYDKGTNRLYLRARDYDASTGRFTQQDGWGYGDIQDPLSLNLYTYCHNNPIMWIDPSGHIAIVPILINIGIGAAADVLTQVMFNFLFNPECQFDIGASFGEINWWQVVVSGATSAITAGPWVKAAINGAGAIAVNWLTEGENYSLENALIDFATGFFGSLLSSGIDELINKYGIPMIMDGLRKLGIDDTVINTFFGIADDVVETEPFVPDDYWTKNAPERYTPNSRIIHYKRNGKTMEKSIVIYDNVGYQKYRIDFNNHGRTDHSKPHLHELTFNVCGKKISEERHDLWR